MNLEPLQRSLADRYRIERELGQGGMATVYLAEDLKHDRKVALKVLKPELAAVLGAERFVVEIKTTAALQHPHILPLFDSGRAVVPPLRDAERGTGGEAFLYYVMPYIEGETLRGRLDREHMLPVDSAVQIATEVADALGHAHSLGIIHRDIKPENILISGGHALVADFGIARAISEAGGTTRLTETGMAVGTPLYMSPEQAVGEQVGPTADLYSLACMLYEMLAGHPPFSGSNARQIMARHAMEQAPSLQVVRDTVPDEVEDAVMAALNKMSADRPQTAAQFAELLGVSPGLTANRYSLSRAQLQRRTASRLTPAGAVTLTVGRRSLVVATAVVALALILIGATWYVRRQSAAGPTLDLGGLDPHNIAVLYFKDESPEHNLEFVADGLTQGLITALGSVPGLSLVSSGGVAPYRGAGVARDSIARALQVGTLVQGSVEPEHDSLRVTIRILDDAGIELDRATFKKAGTDLVALSDSLAQEAAIMIRRRLGVEVRLRRTRADTRSTEAWAMYQRAVQRRGRGDSLYHAGDAAGFDREYLAADSLAGLAERADPTWTTPIVLRGTLDYWRSRRATDDPGSASRAIDAGLAHAERALGMDKDDPEALELRGNLRYWRWLYPLEADSVKRAELFNGARTDLERAIQLYPNLASAYAMLSHLYANAPEKSLVDVILMASKAMEKDAYLDNAAAVLNRLTHAAYDLGQFPDADKWCRDGRRRFPGNWRFVECELLIMTAKFPKPDPARAWLLADSVVRLTPDERDQRFERLYTRVLVAGVLARAGLRDSAQRVLRGTRDDPEVDPSRDLANTAAFIWTLVGDTAEAINQIKVYLVANPGRRADFRDSPNWWFRGISTDPRYQALVAR